ncbi:hypothetical protein RV11_GL003521 [Enterococcus phoeniculicola]|uniref:Uncharacterized protein n=1 Tax=Enterococcus phoeniculicola ATCC BAA-412 TaxID=1158610 RepID=R3W2V8_9ENTE|nr:hypothetical protein UC3_02330 [Enterococcus phoeniculicola ATCC BAA-412]EOT79739.1 hypothetical protein I589_01251 [Enterococcus phoeniculicola ATCC BAA-412]OJG71800.1 hypothetical protein RV11_GL003521 [Enterococcus phoeniculicola]
MIFEITIVFGVLAICMGILLSLNGIRWGGFNKESKFPLRITEKEYLYISLFFIMSGLLLIFVALKFL